MRSSTSLLGLAHEGEDPDEDVGEVEEDVHCDIDGVVERPVEPSRHVQVVDHDGAEQDQHRPVKNGERQLHVDAERR